MPLSLAKLERAKEALEQSQDKLTTLIASWEENTRENKRLNQLKDIQFKIEKADKLLQSVKLESTGLESLIIPSFNFDDPKKNTVFLTQLYEHIQSLIKVVKNICIQVDYKKSLQTEHEQACTQEDLEEITHEDQLTNYPFEDSLEALNLGLLFSVKDRSFGDNDPSLGDTDSLFKDPDSLFKGITDEDDHITYDFRRALDGYEDEKHNSKYYKDLDRWLDENNTTTGSTDLITGTKRESPDSITASLDQITQANKKTKIDPVEQDLYTFFFKQDEGIRCHSSDDNAKKEAKGFWEKSYKFNPS